MGREGSRARCHSRDALRPSFMKIVRPKKKGAGKAGCALHPRSRVQCAFSKKRTRAYRFSGSCPAFPAQWFYGLLRALPGEPGFLATIASVMRKHHRRLDASVGASGPHDFAVRISAARPRASIARRRHRVHRIPLQRSVTIAIRPSFGTGRTR